MQKLNTLQMIGPHFLDNHLSGGGQELNMNDIESVNVTNGVYRISSRSIYNRDEIKLWGTLYNLLFVLNEKTEEYVQSEINNCIGSQSVLGVLVRGTDYTGTKPKGHPIQPDIEDVIREVRKEFGNGNYDAIYLATEEEQIYHKFNTEFPGMIITNRRVYYDSIYYANGLKLIGKVHFNREYDDYYKGIEYLSSIWILSKCKSLIAGHCGGSRAAVFLNNGLYEYLHIFDLGLYK